MKATRLPAFATEERRRAWRGNGRRGGHYLQTGGLHAGQGPRKIEPAHPVRLGHRMVHVEVLDGFRARATADHAAIEDQQAFLVLVVPGDVDRRDVVDLDVEATPVLLQVLAHRIRLLQLVGDALADLVDRYLLPPDIHQHRLALHQRVDPPSRALVGADVALGPHFQRFRQRVVLVHVRGELPVLPGLVVVHHDHLVPVQPRRFLEAAEGRLGVPELEVHHVMVAEQLARVVRRTAMRHALQGP